MLVDALLEGKSQAFLKTSTASAVIAEYFATETQKLRFQNGPDFNWIELSRRSTVEITINKQT